MYGSHWICITYVERQGVGRYIEQLDFVSEVQCVQVYWIQGDEFVLLSLYFKEFMLSHGVNNKYCLRLYWNNMQVSQFN